MKKSQVLKILKKTRQKGISVVSFDIFDTVLFRRVPSEYVSLISAELLSLELGKKYGLHFPAEKILKLRKEFSNKKHSYKATPWKFRDFLVYVSKFCEIPENQLIDIGLEAETQAEIQTLVPCQNSKKAVDLLKKQGARVIAITDMWLPSDSVKFIVEHFGFAFERIYSSSDLGMDKKSGRIFASIEKEFKGTGGGFLHIGDNLVSDFLNPKLSDWCSIWTPRPHPKLGIWIPKPCWVSFLKPTFSLYATKILEGQVKNADDKDPVAQLSRSCLSPFMVLFALIQMKHFHPCQIEDVLFVARDAKIPYEVFNTLKSILAIPINAHYIRLSRKAVASLYPGNPVLNARFLPGKMGRKNIGQWFSNFPLSDQLKSRILKENDIDPNSPIAGGNKNKLRKALKKHEEEIAKDIENMGDTLKSYLGNFIDLQDNRPFGLVDSGWAGTIQDCIANALGKTRKLVGVYIGVSGLGENSSPKSQKSGVLFDANSPRNYHNIFDQTAGAIRVWDILLREPTNTVKCLCKNGNKAFPVLSSCPKISSEDKEIHGKLLNCITDQIEKNKDDLKILYYLSKHFDRCELEKAACHFSHRITVFPSPIAAREIFRLSIDEGTGGNEKSSISIDGLGKGIAWYPGLLSVSVGRPYAMLITSVANFFGKRIVYRRRIG